MKTQWSILIIAALLFTTVSHSPAEMSSASFKIYGSNLNGGGNVPTATDDGTGSGSFLLGTSQGQSSPIGESSDFAGTFFVNRAGFWYLLASLAPDTDGDGVPDNLDNCTLVANPGQLDTDGDLYGNICDTDLNNDNITNFLDLGSFKSVFMTPDADADFNGDGNVNFLDLGILKSSFMQPPGPSGFVP